MDLTKTQVELVRENAAQIAKHGVDDPAIITALCTLALRGLECHPRPLAEIEGPALVIYHIGDDTLPSHVIVGKRPNGTWASHSLGKAWPDTTLAIPLSALPAPPEGK